MVRTAPWCAMSIVMVLLSGCGATPSPMQWPEALPLAAEHETPREPRVAEAITVPASAAGTLTLDDALALALTNHPALNVAAWDIQARDARAQQAGLGLNPTLGLEVENFAGTDDASEFSGAETSLTIAQVIPGGDRLARAARVAALDRDLAGWDYEATRIQVAANTAGRFIELVVSQRRLDLARANQDLAARVASIATRRVEAGDVPTRERIRAELAASRAGLDVTRAEATIRSHKLALSMQWGESDPMFDTVSGDLERLDPPPTRDALLAALDDHPALARWALETSRRRAALMLAEALAKPDVELEGGIRYLADADDFAFVAGLSVPLTVRDRNQGEIRAVRAELARTAHERRREETALRLALIEAHATLVMSRNEALALRDDMLPAAQRVFDAANRAYELGQIDWLEEVESQRTLAELQSSYLDALADYHRASVAIEALIGRPLHSPALPAPIITDEDPS